MSRAEAGASRMDTPLASAPTASSPRTAEMPMAFRYDELFSGAMIAAFTFAAVAPVVGILWLFGWTLISGGRIDGQLFAVFFWYLPAVLVMLVPSLIAAVAELPIAWLLGRALRRERRRRMHLLAFAALGAVSTVLWAVVFGLAVTSAWSHPGDLDYIIGIVLPLGVTAAPAGAGAAAFGWHRAMRQALADDAEVAADREQTPSG